MNEISVLSLVYRPLSVLSSHSARNIDLVPSAKSGQAYFGSVMGREIVFHRGREQVQADLDQVNPALKKSRTFKK